MLQLRKRDITPQNGWDSLQPDGTLITGGDLGDLIVNVLNYRVEKGLPTGNLAAEVEDEICRRKPVKCRPEQPPVTGAKREINVADVWRFIFTLTKWLKDRTFVPQEEAERRAEICSGCAYQAEPTGCWGCTGLFALLFALIGDKRTKMDENLKSCSICACENKAQVFAPLAVLHKVSGKLEYPSDTTGAGGPPCWKRRVD